MVYVAVSADEVSRVSGTTRLPETTLRQYLLNAPLLPFLQRQMAMLVSPPEPADASNLDGILDSAIDLSLIMLAQAAGHDITESAQFRRALFQAATQLIVRNLDDPELGVDALARKLGCSRATLYRAFADLNLTIAGHIRELRLIQVRHLLEHAAPSDEIGDLVTRCGLEVIHFSRLFRHHFGITPRDVKGIRFGHAEAGLTI
jgi:AraC-like DNA-binding protein